MKYHVYIQLRRYTGNLLACHWVSCRDMYIRTSQWIKVCILYTPHTFPPHTIEFPIGRTPPLPQIIYLIDGSALPRILRIVTISITISSGYLHIFLLRYPQAVNVALTLISIRSLSPLTFTSTYFISIYRNDPGTGQAKTQPRSPANATTSDACGVIRCLRWRTALFELRGRE